MPSRYHGKTNTPIAPTISKERMAERVTAFLASGLIVAEYASQNGPTKAQKDRLSKEAGKEELRLVRMGSKVDGEIPDKRTPRAMVTLGERALKAVQGAGMRSVEYLREIEHLPLERLKADQHRRRQECLNDVRKIPPFKPLTESTGFDTLHALPDPDFDNGKPKTVPEQAPPRMVDGQII